MTVEVIEGEAVEVIEPHRAIVPVQPGQVIVTDTTPADMLERATAIATALSAMVEKQGLFTVIQGKKYPQVEAWQTIGRMDNVVAREASAPIAHEDGSWEAAVELVRLSDGMVIGNGSALCGSKGDRPWDTRPAHQRRSMAVTRATSRAFRQQYSWIMALAGYEPTPADEMPQEGEERPATARSSAADSDGGLTGEAITQGNQDYQLREGPDDATLPFRVREGRRTQIVMAHGDLARTLALLGDQVLGHTVTVWGHFSDESFRKGDRDVTYTILHAERIRTPEWVLPSESPAGNEEPQPGPEAAA